MDFGYESLKGFLKSSLDEGIIEITLHKAHLAETWPCVFRGHETMNAIELEETKQSLLLERFQREVSFCLLVWIDLFLSTKDSISLERNSMG
jgi:hypothetical protein